MIAFACMPNAETEARLYAALLAADIFVKVDPSSLDPETGLPIDANRVDLWTAELPDGNRAIGIFTSADAMAAAFPDGTPNHYLAYRGVDVLAFAGEGSLALNWGFDPHVILTPESIARLRDRARGHTRNPPAPNLHDSGSPPASLPR